MRLRKSAIRPDTNSAAKTPVIPVSSPLPSAEPALLSPGPLTASPNDRRRTDQIEINSDRAPGTVDRLLVRGLLMALVLETIAIGPMSYELIQRSRNPQFVAIPIALHRDGEVSYSIPAFKDTIERELVLSIDQAQSWLREALTIKQRDLTSQLALWNDRVRCRAADDFWKIWYEKAKSTAEAVYGRRPTLYRDVAKMHIVGADAQKITINVDLVPVDENRKQFAVQQRTFVVRYELRPQTTTDDKPSLCNPLGWYVTELEDSPRL